MVPKEIQMGMKSTSEHRVWGMQHARSTNHWPHSIACPWCALGRLLGTLVGTLQVPFSSLDVVQVLVCNPILTLFCHDYPGQLIPTKGPGFDPDQVPEACKRCAYTVSRSVQEWENMGGICKKREGRRGECQKGLKSHSVRTTDLQKPKSWSLQKLFKFN